MISDVLHDAILDINKWQHSLPGVYGEYAEDIESVAGVMDALRAVFDSLVESNEEHQRLLDDIRASLKALANSDVIGARNRLMEWVERERLQQKGVL